MTGYYDHPRVFFKSLVAFIGLVAFSLGLKAQTPTTLRVGGGNIDFRFDESPTTALQRVLLDWTTKAARAVTIYYGRYPVSHVVIYFHITQGNIVGSGRASGEGGAEIHVEIGRGTTADDIAKGDSDWLMTHEMVHLALPSVEPEHHWIEEGLATYVEPIARVRAGELRQSRVWADMMDQMPQGQPAPGDRGLDRTPTWGRTYWGGAIFCLLADVKIREVTHNRSGLETALRGVLRADGSLAKEWPLTRVLDVGDATLGVAVLRPLYEQMKYSSQPVDLDTLWQQLGIKKQGNSITFDDQAPLAAIRKSIMAP